MPTRSLSSFSQNIPGGTYIVTKKLAEPNGEFEYRVKSVNERFERVVSQSELSEIPWRKAGQCVDGGRLGHWPNHDKGEPDHG
jgi:hypothetical protein